MINRLTSHAVERALNRISKIGLNANKILQYASRLAGASRFRSEAIKILSLENQHKKAWSDVSNGDEIWAIVRDGILITLMFRRSTQPKTCESLRVNKVTVGRE